MVLKEELSLVRGQSVWKYNGMVMVFDKIVLKAGGGGVGGGEGGHHSVVVRWVMEKLS